MAAEFIRSPGNPSGCSGKKAPMKHDDLWNFALACYSQPGVEEACLDLQAAGGDVCLLLTCAWLECRGTAHDDARLQLLQRISEDWRTLVVAPLRTLRQAWREPAAADADLAELRKRVKALELDAERVQLLRLQSVTQHWSVASGSADWIGRACASLGPATFRPIETLRAAAQLVAGD